MFLRVTCFIRTLFGFYRSSCEVFMTVRKDRCCQFWADYFHLDTNSIVFWYLTFIQRNISIFSHNSGSFVTLCVCFIFIAAIACLSIVCFIRFTPKVSSLFWLIHFQVYLSLPSTNFSSPFWLPPFIMPSLSISRPISSV